MMRDQSLFQLAGAAAIAAGLLRSASGIAPSFLSAHALQDLYFVIDVLLVFGLIGIYATYRQSTGAAGLIGFVVAIIGLLMVRSGGLFGGYATGAAVTSIGTVVLGVPMLTRSNVPRLPPLLWIAAFACGLVGTLSAATAWAAASGIAFGVGIALAGVNILVARRTVALA